MDMGFVSPDLRNPRLVQNAKDNRTEKSVLLSPPLTFFFFFLFLFQEVRILLRAKDGLLER